MTADVEHEDRVEDAKTADIECWLWGPLPPGLHRYPGLDWYRDGRVNTGKCTATTKVSFRETRSLKRSKPLFGSLFRSLYKNIWFKSDRIIDFLIYFSNCRSRILADPGKARGCPTNSFVNNCQTPYFNNSKTNSSTKEIWMALFLGCC